MGRHRAGGLDLPLCPQPGCNLRLRPTLLGLLAFPAVIVALWACDGRTWRWSRPVGPPAAMPLMQAYVACEVGERGDGLFVRYNRSPSGLHLIGGPALVTRRRWGWTYRSTPPGERRTLHEVFVDPLWVVGPALLGFAVAATSVVHRHRLGRARRAGRCVGCGYDLRATPDRCPECGRPST